MRIRKNRKLTANMIWSTAASSTSPNPPEELMQPHICVVNRSPWDLPPSPPPPPLLDYAHGEFLPSPISSSHHHHNQVMEKVDNSYPINGSFACDYSLPIDNSHRSINSIKISSDYEKNSSILPNLPSNARKDNKASTMGPPRQRGRPRKEVETLSMSPSVTHDNPNEFYYYSGFGPRWGKRRGSDHLQKPIATEDINYVADHRGKMNASLSCSTIEETCNELVYIDDDEDNCGQKRARKRVKAKSLKSLFEC